MFQTNLKRLREIKGVSQAGLAKAIGVGVSTVGMWENGKNKPDSKNLEKLADFFEVSVSELYADETMGKHTSNPRFDGMDVEEMVDFLANNEKGRVLMSIAKDATKEDLEQIVRIVEALRG